MNISLKPISLKAKPKTGTLAAGPRITLKGIKKQTLDDDNIPIEEHFLLRVLHPETATKLREAVRKREVPESLKIHIKEDLRKAAFTLDETTLDAVLVDLPCILESQKTLDNKQFYKIADISQVPLHLLWVITQRKMLIVQDGDTPIPNLPKSKEDMYQYPHGISTPLKFVRKRRFRKRISKKGIEDVEREVARLLAADAAALEVQYELYDQKEYEESYRNEEDAGVDETQPDAGEMDEMDLDFAAELEEALEAELEEHEGLSETSDEEGDVDESDEDGEKNPADQQRGVLDEEIRDLEAKIVEKRQAMEAQANIIMKRRIEEIVKTLTNELEIKRRQLVELWKEWVHLDHQIQLSFAF